jgi:hypothetical protein
VLPSALVPATATARRSARFFGVGAIILLPIFYGFFGFVGTLIMAALFNVAAGMVGGIEVDAR